MTVVCSGIPGQWLANLSRTQSDCVKDVTVSKQTETATLTSS